MSLGLELKIRERVSSARKEVYKTIPFLSTYRPISETIGVTPGLVVFLYGNSKITKEFLYNYTYNFFNSENEITIIETPPEPGSKEFKEVLKDKVNLIILDEVRDDKLTARRIEEFRRAREDKDRIMFVRPAENSEIDRLSKVGCETTYVSDVLLPFPRRAPQTQSSAEVRLEESFVPTDAMLYLWEIILPHKYIDRRRLSAVRKIFNYLAKLTGKYFRKPPTFNEEAFANVLRTFKRYRSKDVPTIQDIVAIVPLFMAPKMLVTGEVVKKRLQKSYYYVKKFLGEVDLDELSEEELLKMSELGGFVIFDVLRFAEGIVKYILSG